MDENKLRDLVASQLESLESGLTLLGTEQYIPSEIGTRSFVDLYARDSRGRHVLIELKRSDAASREAIHELNKYVEAVKGYFGAKDSEIRTIIASTEWKELLVPFSRFVSDTSISVKGQLVEVNADQSNFSVKEVTPLRVGKGRFIAPWHDLFLYRSEKSMRRGLAALQRSLRTKRIADNVILVLKMRSSQPSAHQQKMMVAVRSFASQAGAPPARPTAEILYEYALYLGLQIMSDEQCLEILQRDPIRRKEALETIQDMDADEASQYLHSEICEMHPRGKQDYYEIGYPAKFTELLRDAEIAEIRRGGLFERNALLSDEAIVSELKGEDGQTRQRFTCSLAVKDKAAMTAAKAALADCLRENINWREQIRSALEEIESEFPQAEIDISLFNPSTGVLTLYYAAQPECGLMYVPTYSIIVRLPEVGRLYYGGLRGSGHPLAFTEILAKYYDSALSALFLSMTWGGRDDRDAAILEDMGLVYTSYMCELKPNKEYFIKDGYKWKSCESTDGISKFYEYMVAQESFAKGVVETITSKISNGVVMLAGNDEVESKASSERLSVRWKPRVLPDSCAECGSALISGSMVLSGRAKGGSVRQFWCQQCGDSKKRDLESNSAQLFLGAGDDWMLVASEAPRDE